MRARSWSRNWPRDLLPDWTEDWLVPERRRWLQVRLHTLEAIAAHLAQGNGGSAPLHRELGVLPSQRMTRLVASQPTLCHASGVDRLLVVLRHAKSAWPDGVDDHERPLGPRGLRDAPKAGRWLREHDYLPERVRCSTARRARETWQLVSGELEQRPPVEYDGELYGGDYLDIVRRTSDEVTRLALVGHEPSVSEVTFELAGRTAIDAFPTGAVAVFEVAESWARLDRAQLTAFFRPRDFA